MTEQEAVRFEQAASEPKLTKWYDSGHMFNAKARQDRAQWLYEQLELAPIAPG